MWMKFLKDNNKFNMYMYILKDTNIFSCVSDITSHSICILINAYLYALKHMHVTIPTGNQN